MNDRAYRACYNFHKARLEALGSPTFWEDTDEQGRRLFDSFDGDDFAEDLVITVLLDVIRHAEPLKDERANRLRWLVDRLKGGDGVDDKQVLHEEQSCV